MIRLAIIAASAALLSACASTSLPTSELQPVPAERVTWGATAPAPHGVLAIARDGGFAGVAARVHVSIDGQPAADMRSSEILRLPVAPGRRIVTAQSFAASGGETRRPRSLEVTVAEGQETLVRIGFDDMASGFSLWQDVKR